MHIAMISITMWAAAMMEGTVVDVMLIRPTVQSVDALTQMEVGEEQLAHQLLQLHQLLLLHQLLPLRAILQEQALLRIQQQLEDARATLHGLVIHGVMISITTWTAVMMVETVVDVTSKQITVMYVHALTQMEAGEEQLAHQLLQLHQLQPSQLCQQLMTQVTVKKVFDPFCFAYTLGLLPLHKCK